MIRRKFIKIEPAFYYMLTTTRKYVHIYIFIVSAIAGTISNILCSTVPAIKYQFASLGLSPTL